MFEASSWIFEAKSLKSSGKFFGIVWKIFPWEIPQIIRLDTLQTFLRQFFFPGKVFGLSTVFPTVWLQYKTSRESQNAALRTSHWFSNVSNNTFQKNWQSKKVGCIIFCGEVHDFSHYCHCCHYFICLTTFSVLFERAIWHIWQLVWCFQGSVLQFSQCFVWCCLISDLFFVYLPQLNSKCNKCIFHIKNIIDWFGIVKSVESISWTKSKSENIWKKGITSFLG